MEQRPPLRLLLFSSCGTIFSFRKTTPPGVCVCPPEDELPSLPLLEMEISCPSSLHVQLVRASPPELPVCYVRQTYLSKRASVPDEIKRCFLADGHVIKFLRDGSFHVFCPDGSKYECPPLPVQPPTASQSGTSNITTDLPRNAKSDTPVTAAHKTDVKKGKKMQDRESTVMESASVAPSTMTAIIPPPQTVDSWTSIMPDGRRYRAAPEQAVIELAPRVLVRTSTDWQVKETFIRRGDGTNTLMQGDDTRIVNFPDGTRISTTVFEEEDEVWCEWSVSELDRFTAWYVRHKQMRSVKARHIVAAGKVILQDDGFVSVRIRYRMEHPEYATVTYSGWLLPVQLLMPGNSAVNAFTEGTYSVNLLKKVSFEVNDVGAWFRHGEWCESFLQFTGYNLPDSDVIGRRNSHLLYSSDCKGRGFYVNYLGETKLVEEDPGPWPLNPAEFRCFVMHRDLSGVQLIHEDAATEWLKDYRSRDEKGAVSLPLPLAEGLQYHITMAPLLHTLAQCWTVDYAPCRIHYEQRRRHVPVPSTYGHPPSWFHPFPKQRVVKTLPEEVLNPEVLLMRMLCECSQAGAAAVETVARALRQYEKTVEDLLEEHHNQQMRYVRLHTDSPSVCSKASSCTVVEHLEEASLVPTRINHVPITKLHKMHWQPLAVLRSSVRLSTDFIALEDSGAQAAVALFRRALELKLSATAEDSASCKHWVRHAVCRAIARCRLRKRLEAAERHRRALREHLVPPYFSSPQGVAFCICNELGDRALPELPSDHSGDQSEEAADSSSDEDLAACISTLRW